MHFLTQAVCVCVFFIMPFIEEQFSPTKRTENPHRSIISYFLFFPPFSRIFFFSDWRCAFTDALLHSLYAFLLLPRPLQAPLLPSRTQCLALGLFNISPPVEGCFIYHAVDTCGDLLALMAALRRYSSQRSSGPIGVTEGKVPLFVWFCVCVQVCEPSIEDKNGPHPWKKVLFAVHSIQSRPFKTFTYNCALICTTQQLDNLMNV